MTNIFRADNTNVGDWWSPPARYFPFKDKSYFDIIDPSLDFSNEKFIVVGGGGLGTDFFRPYLKRLEEQAKKAKLIAWGVGVDNFVKPGSFLPEHHSFDLLGDWFDRFDAVGTRVYDANQRFDWVPCASCMHDDLLKYRDTKPSKLLGIYNHKRAPLNLSTDQFSVNDNGGNNFREKITFLSDHEFILTNTYHGVFWATLLNRKVICVPFKSGMFSFKHKPIYLSGLSINDTTLHAAVSYPDSLEECRAANVDFFIKLHNLYETIF